MKLKKTKRMYELGNVVTGSLQSSGGEQGHVETLFSRALYSLARDVANNDVEFVDWNVLKRVYAGAPEEWRSKFSLSAVCKGSELRIGEEGGGRKDGKTSTKSKELVKRLEMLQEELDRKRYDAMVEDVIHAEKSAKIRGDHGIVSYKEQLRYGAHVIVVMAVFFIFGYTLTGVLSQSESIKLVGGMVCMFFGMVVETLLLVLRGIKQERGIDNDRKIKQKVIHKQQRQRLEKEKDV